MRLAIVTHLRRAEDVGVNLQIVPMSRSCGWRVYLITEDFYGEVPSDEPNDRTSSTNAGISFFGKVIHGAMKQIRIARRILKNSSDFDVLMFHVGSDLILPILVSRLLRKKVVLVVTGSMSKSSLTERGSIGVYTLLTLVETLAYALSTKVLVYTKSCVMFFNLESLLPKIIVSNAHFVDIDEFCIKKEPKDRGNLIGYLGRLSPEKGVVNLAKAFISISREIPDSEILFIGDGPLRPWLEESLFTASLQGRSSFVGWQPHDQLPSFLNEIRVMVVPSFTEGLPNAVLEAMACGTPVLSTVVGSVPDLIKEGVTGFLMESNSTECIKMNLSRVLAHRDLSTVSANGRRTIETDFTYEAALQRWKRIENQL